MSNRSVDYTRIYLSSAQWDTLLGLTTRSAGKHQSGGWQNRLRAWRETMDYATRSILLSHVSHSPRALDDMTFVAHAIAQKNVGGWQNEAYKVFANSHPRFTGIWVAPRPRRMKSPQLTLFKGGAA